MSTPDPTANEAALPLPASLPRLPRAGFFIAWACFWVLMATLSVQEYARQGHAEIWPPLVWEGTSFVGASAIVAAQWRRAVRLDRLLTRPARWFLAGAAWLPVAAVSFVICTFALRHGVYALLGLTYRHEPWPVVFRYETLKFSIFYLLFLAAFFGVRSHALLSAERLRAEQALALSQRAQLLQLAQQLQPHFLFNALNTIASTIHTDPDLADALLTRLAALLRAATDLARRPESTLDEELHLVEGYAAIMGERFGERASVRFECDPAARACRVPTLALQPLLENAFRHAVEPRRERTTIVVRTRRTDERLVLEVEDDGGTLPAAPRFGVGLSNLRDRLAAQHGAHATLTLEARPQGGVVARLELPCTC
jgi:sensor histidine kinase YesM